MNEKNKGKRKSATVSATAHRRLKTLSKHTGVRMEKLFDEAVFEFVKNPNLSQLLVTYQGTNES